MSTSFKVTEWEFESNSRVNPWAKGY